MTRLRSDRKPRVRVLWTVSHPNFLGGHPAPLRAPLRSHNCGNARATQADMERSFVNAVMSAPEGRTRPRRTKGKGVFTKDILFGMNILTLAGFALTGLTLTLNRMGQVGKALSIGL